MPLKIASKRTVDVSVIFTPHASEPSLESIEIGTNAGHRFITVQGVGYQVMDAVDPIRTQSFAVYPNPASSFVRVEGTGQIQISDLLGREILRSQEVDIDVASLADGIYIVRDTHGHATRLIIARP
jgi:hypothetical protein